jgi:Fe-S-cluster containining protein
MNMGFVVEHSPCQHLKDGLCDDYENRPQACKEFPSALHPVYNPHCAIMRSKFKEEK